MTRVLVTNDDGVSAPGIRELAAVAAERGHDVVVAAPLEEASGTSAAMSAVVREGRVVVEQRDGGVDGVATFGVDASPSYIVTLGVLGAFGPPPDFVLSGINRGANAGHAILHSGTVGAALTAAAAERRAMAVSLDVLSPARIDLGKVSASSGGAAIAALDTVDDQTRNWKAAATWACDLLPVLEAMPDGHVLNLNVPDRPAEDVRGLRQARLARFGQVQLTVIEAGEGFLRTAVQESEAEPDPGTDLACLAEGWATVTAIRALGVADQVDHPLLREAAPTAGS